MKPPITLNVPRNLLCEDMRGCVHSYGQKFDCERIRVAVKEHSSFPFKRKENDTMRGSGRMGVGRSKMKTWSGVATRLLAWS